MQLFHSNDMTFLPTVEKLCVMRRDALSNGDVSLADAIGRRLHLLMLIHTAKKKADKRHQAELRMLERNPSKQLKRKNNQSMFDAAIEEQKLKIADIVSSNLLLAVKNALILANNSTLSRLLSSSIKSIYTLILSVLSTKTLRKMRGIFVKTIISMTYSLWNVAHERAERFITFVIGRFNNEQKRLFATT